MKNPALRVLVTSTVLIPVTVDYLSFRPSRCVMKNGWVNPTITPK